MENNVINISYVNNLEELSVAGRIILKYNFKKLDEGTWTGLVCLRIGRAGGHF
jgi:hypothetical protein